VVETNSFRPAAIVSRSARAESVLWTVVTSIPRSLKTSVWSFISAMRGLTTMVVPSSASAGSWKQRLLPDPVGMMTIVSRPSIAAWTACAWPGRNRRKPNRSRRLCLSSRPLNRVAWVMIPPFLS
jgi:hypothetical protein